MLEVYFGLFLGVLLSMQEHAYGLVLGSLFGKCPSPNIRVQSCTSLGRPDGSMGCSISVELFTPEEVVYFPTRTEFDVATLTESSRKQILGVSQLGVFPPPFFHYHILPDLVKAVCAFICKLPAWGHCYLGSRTSLSPVLSMSTSCLKGKSSKQQNPGKTLE